MPKRTFQPNNRRRVKVHGFSARMKTPDGRAAPDDYRLPLVAGANGHTLPNTTV